MWWTNYSRHACGTGNGRHPQVREAGVVDELLTACGTGNVRHPQVRGAGVELHQEALGWRPNSDGAEVLELQGQVVMVL